MDYVRCAVQYLYRKPFAGILASDGTILHSPSREALLLEDLRQLYGKLPRRYMNGLRGVLRKHGVLCDNQPVIAITIVGNATDSAIAYTFCSQHEGRNKFKCSPSEIYNRKQGLDHILYGQFNKQKAKLLGGSLAYNALRMKESYCQLLDWDGDDQLCQGFTPLRLWKMVGLSEDSFPKYQVIYFPNYQHPKLQKSTMIFGYSMIDKSCMCVDIESTYPIDGGYQYHKLDPEVEAVGRKLYPQSRRWK